MNCQGFPLPESQTTIGMTTLVGPLFGVNKPVVSGTALAAKRFATCGTYKLWSQSVDRPSVSPHIAVDPKLFENLNPTGRLLL